MEVVSTLNSGPNIHDHLKMSLSKIITDEGFLSFKLETNFIEPSGGNFLGELYDIQITGKTERGDKVLNLFIKTILPFGNDLDYISCKEIYLREIFVYTKINAIFEELQTKFHVPDIERYKLVKFYDAGNAKALIMENLKRKGFEVPERLEIPSLSFSEIAIKQLAKFHALSFVIKTQKPKFFDKEVKSKKYLVDFNDTWQSIKDNSITTAIETLQNAKAKEKFIKYISTVNTVAKFEKYLKADHVNIGVFCHGDYRTQNILLRKNDGVKEEIIPIDYQLTYYGHPVNDIIFYFFTATDQKFRLNHMDYLKTLYYDTLKDYLLYFDLDIKDVYPKRQYEIDFKERLDYGLLVGIIFLPYLLAPEIDVPNLSMDLATKVFVKSDIYVKCINELVDDFIDWGYL